MLSFLHTALTAIKKISEGTTDAKLVRLSGLETKINAIISTVDLNLSALDDLINYCIKCLNDQEFTYKQISLFGLLTSRCEDLARQLYTQVLFDRSDLCLDLLSQIHADHIKELTQLIRARNYNAAREKLLDVDELFRKDLPETLAYMYTWLKAKLEIQISLPIKNVYVAIFSSLVSLEKKSVQRVYDLNEINMLMQKQHLGHNLDFIYAIDFHGNVLFSRSAEDSFHINLCHGDSVYGAGEIYLTKTNSGIDVTILNNKSGLYKPRIEFLAPLKNWLTKQGLNTENINIYDEREALIKNELEFRFFIK